MIGSTISGRDEPTPGMAKGYVYAWEFRVPLESREAFERHYGAEGSWVQLFRRAPGYIGTLLLEDRTTPGRYLTIDRWQDEAAYVAFRAAFSRQYDALDRECAALTTDERLLGTFKE